MKQKRYVIIGASAAGASCAAKLRRLSESAQITLLEKGPYLSYSACSLPYYLSGVVSKADDLVLMTPMSFKKKFNIDAKVNAGVASINREKKTVTVVPASGKSYEEPYDVLILATGSKARIPGWAQNQPRCAVLRSVEDAAKLRNTIETTHPSSILIVGAGLAAVEIAENLAKTGADISICQRGPQILSSFDGDMASILLKELLDHGIHVYLNDSVSDVKDDTVLLSSGKEVPADLIIVAAGTVPNTALAQKAGLSVNTKTGALLVDDNGKTSDSSIYGAGDMTETVFMPENQKGVSSQAGPSQQEGRIAALAISGQKTYFFHSYHSLVVPVFSLQAAQCGLSEKKAKALHFSIQTAVVVPPDRVSLMPGVSPIFLKVVFETPTGRVLGAQAIGKGDVLRRIAVIDAVMQKGGTLEDLAALDLPYAPLFSNAKDAVNIAGMTGLHILRGDYKQVSVADVPRLVKEHACIIDVREPGEWKQGHLQGALSIPLTELRKRAGEIPKDQPVYLHCRSGQRSYYAICILQHLGWTNLYNISGAYLFLTYYDYVHNMLNGKPSLLTRPSH
jgi:NADPH-dependent 2,4-dienoyl-CoA reductase/sulfur reductase-like enzyme/rhodanese-related sulfurtransferase